MFRWGKAHAGALYFPNYIVISWSSLSVSEATLKLMTKKGLYFPNHIVQILLLQIPAYIKLRIAIPLFGEARIDGSSLSVSEDRPEIDPFRTKNVD